MLENLTYDLLFATPQLFDDQILMISQSEDYLSLSLFLILLLHLDSIE